jgi:hypothetical protein
VILIVRGSGEIDGRGHREIKREKSGIDTVCARVWDEDGGRQ